MKNQFNTYNNILRKNDDLDNAQKKREREI